MHGTNPKAGAASSEKDNHPPLSYLSISGLGVFAVLEVLRGCEGMGASEKQKQWSSS